jgi:hypothetical protein
MIVISPIPGLRTVLLTVGFTPNCIEYIFLASDAVVGVSSRVMYEVTAGKNV